LEITKTRHAATGKTSAHVECDCVGSHVIVIYDTRTLEEVKRIPMSRPSGEYNVWNKVTFSQGTSH
jgi:hypothetical protein